MTLRFLFVTLMVLAWGTLPGEESSTLWQIGSEDDDTRELALAPDGYAAFHEDPVFLVGHSDPRKEWPYALPGPDDSWAGDVHIPSRSSSGSLRGSPRGNALSSSISSTPMGFAPRRCESP